MARIISLIYGIAFLAVGVLGTVTGGHDHLLFSLFGINFFHNTVHLFSGLVALGCYALGEEASRGFLWFIAIVYGLVVLGGLCGITPIVNAFNLNAGDNILHLALVLGAVYGLAKSSRQLQPI